MNFDSGKRRCLPEIIVFRRLDQCPRSALSVQTINDPRGQRCSRPTRACHLLIIGRNTMIGIHPFRVCGFVIWVFQWCLLPISDLSKLFTTKYVIRHTKKGFRTCPQSELRATLSVYLKTQGTDWSADSEAIISDCADVQDALEFQRSYNYKAREQWVRYVSVLADIYYSAFTCSYPRRYC